MRSEDVPLGWLVIAVEVENKVYCLECGNGVDGQALTEDDVAAKRLRQAVGLYCAGCGSAFFTKPADPLFVALANRIGVRCDSSGCGGVASWRFIPADWVVCDRCAETYQGCDVCPCCGQWYQAELGHCPHCGFVFHPLVVVDGLYECRERQHPDGSR